MLRPFAHSARSAAFLRSGASVRPVADRIGRFMSKQSGDDAKPPTALATLYLEDGSTFVGRSFGCHESVDGEVRR